MIKYLITAAFIATLALGAFGGQYAGRYLQTHQDKAETQRLAIANKCGGFNHETGEFGWETVQTAQSVVENASEIQNAVKGDGGIRVDTSSPKKKPPASQVSK